MAEKEQHYLQLFNPEYNIEYQLIIDNLQLSTSIVEYNAFAKQLVLFKSLSQQLTSINSFPNLSLIAWEVKPVYLLIIPSKKSSTPSPPHSPPAPLTPTCGGRRAASQGGF